MSLFAQLVRTAVNVAVLPAKMLADVVCLPTDAADGEVGTRTVAQLEKIKDEAAP